MAKGFVYRGNKRTAEDINKKAKESTKDYDSIYQPGLPVFKPKEGDNLIRILPSGDEDDPDWDLTVQTHYNVGADNARYLCLSKMKEEPCPVCAVIEKLEDEEERDQIRVGKGCAVWIIDRDNEKAGPQLWSMPFTKVRNEIYTRSVDKKTKTPILVDDPEEGYDISFTRKGTGTTTAYSGVEVDRDPSPLHENEKIQERWLEYISEHPLKEVLNFHDADHIEKVLMGQADRKKPDADGDTDTTSRSSRRTARDPEPDPEPEVEPTRSSRASRRGDPDPEPEPEPDSRAARRRALLDDESGKDAEPERPARRGLRATPGDDDIPFDKGKGEEDDTPLTTARRSLERLKRK